jgi:hypothetical protein
VRGKGRGGRFDSVFEDRLGKLGKRMEEEGQGGYVKMKGMVMKIYIIELISVFNVSFFWGELLVYCFV